ncbi:FecR family protein [Aporhodopirellula aestuarii]|uniref:FecR family protein n=1 Tax=Aporhodopirellula aestuarii TaxID=2950107 RepID=A0ABT0U1D1_9BACT|nr:FecR family protein [Aporhodopirellula aestuarii]MCM2370360.1 FecR family protein [Aporhodopirellula aestuarii]
MKPSAQHQRVEELLQLSQGGDATDEQLDELNDLLRNDEDLRFLAIRSMQLDSMLQEEFQLRETALRFDHSSQHKPHPSNNDPQPRASISKSTSFFGPWMLMFAASLVGIAIVYSTLLYNNNQASVQLANNSTKPVLRLSSADSFRTFENVMTVTYEDDTVWDDPINIGDQIDVGQLCLRKGVARLNTVYGAVLILDAREHPVCVEIEPDRSLTVHQGTVFAKAYDQALGFALRTPTTNVVDIGTEFAVSVDTDGQSEVSVLDGAVTWLPIERAANHGRSMLAAGKSVRFRSSADNVGVPLVGQDNHLKKLREFAARINSRENEEQPLMHESFEYPIGVMRKDEGGKGWKAPWFKHSGPELPPSGVIREGGYLIDPAWLIPSSPKYTVVSLASVSARTFAEPIDLSVDQDIFISLLMRKRVITSPRDERCGAGIALQSGFDAKRFGVSIDMREHLTVFTGTEHVGGTTLDTDTTYFLVVKLELRSEEPDRLSVVAYPTSAPPAACEPEVWEVVGKPFHQDGQLDQIRLWSDATAIAAFDEIRIGTSWNSVVPIRH